MRIPSYLAMSWALLLVICGPTVAQRVAVFDFELIDTSLQGEVNGSRADEQDRLTRLGDQLRQRLRVCPETSCWIAQLSEHEAD
jgi:hypothetical protein